MRTSPLMWADDVQELTVENDARMVESGLIPRDRRVYFQVRTRP